MSYTNDGMIIIRILKSNRFRRDQDPLKIAGSSFDDQSADGMSMVVSLHRTITHRVRIIGLNSLVIGLAAAD